MSNDRRSILEQKDLDWSKLTKEQKDEIIKSLAHRFVEIHKKIHQEMFEQMIYDIFTPFWVKWFRNFKKKIQGGNK